MQSSRWGKVGAGGGEDELNSSVMGNVDSGYRTGQDMCERGERRKRRLLITLSTIAITFCDASSGRHRSSHPSDGAREVYVSEPKKNKKQR